MQAVLLCGQRKEREGSLTVSGEVFVWKFAVSLGKFLFICAQMAMYYVYCVLCIV